MNIIYFTGLFFTTTERPFSVFLPADRLATIWFNPGLDRDLVKSWWATESDYYFDFQHADGGFPNEGKVQQGEQVDLFEWVLKGLKKRGYDGKRIATDKDLSRDASSRRRARSSSRRRSSTRSPSTARSCAWSSRPRSSRSGGGPTASSTRPTPSRAISCSRRART